MPRSRIPIIVLLAFVGILGIDFAILRALFVPNPGSNHAPYLVQIDATNFLPFGTLALGVLPMASILITHSLTQILKMLRTATVSRFGIGFQVFGWLAVFLFMSGSALSPKSAQNFILTVASPFQAVFDAIIAKSPPEWVFGGIEMSMVVASFLLPELLLALAGGWLIRRSRASAQGLESFQRASTVSAV